LELQLIHTSHTDATEYDVGLEIPAIFGSSDELLHFEAKSFDVGHGGIKGDVKFEALQQTFATSYVIYPEGVEDVVWDLYKC
jgi:uncharacterized GH25 family protein